jgi:acid phosphatase (class A)
MNPARIALALLLFSCGGLFAKAPVAFHYLAPDSVSLPALLPAPPAPGSPENKADILGVLFVQQSRTPEDVARARSEETLSPAAFANVLGSWFTPARLPLTFALLQDAGSDAESISAAAKELWHRPRPPLQDAGIHPALTLPASPSYPSGHAMRGALWAVILAKLAPDLQDRILARGAQIGEDRVIGGVHFPTDRDAGQKLGSTLAARLLANPAFQRDLALAEAEFSGARPMPTSQR